MGTHSSILAWKIPWTEEPAGLQSMGQKESDTTQQFSTHTQATAYLDSSHSLNLKGTVFISSKAKKTE